MEVLLGTTLLTKKSSPGKTAALLNDKDLVLLYFSASWCPPCKAFTPVLADFYAAHAAKEKFEIVYVSSDRTAADFTAYYAKMPWLALPTDAASTKAKLAKALKVQGIPTLIVLDVKTGLFVTNDARSHIMAAAAAAGQPPSAGQQAIAGWKATPPVPIEQGLAAAAAAAGNGAWDIVSILQQIVMGIVKNPAYIFGTIYLVKWAMRKYAASQPGYEDATAAGVESPSAFPPPYKGEPIPDDEF